MNQFIQYYFTRNSLAYFRRGYFLIFILFVSILNSGCDLFPKTDYNSGYKDGYLAGYNAAKNESVPSEVPASKNETVQTTGSKEENNIIPPKAYEVWGFIKLKNKAPIGYEGGRHFGNYERRLPERDAAGNKVEYREWDINPKVQGKNRGPERLVTGSDGRAWYTADHYNSFHELK